MYNLKKFKFQVAGIIIVTALFFYIELLHPYNFLKDDNFTQFLPVILDGMKQLFNGGFPFLDLHQYTGTKIFESGIYAVLYPITIISYIISHFIFKNDFFLLEIFVLIHIILGFLATYYFLANKIKKLVSLCASIAFVFSGYVLIATSFWYYVIPTIVFLPLMLIFQDKISSSKQDYFKIFLFGITRGVYFYSGNVQYFLFSCMFEALYFILISYQNDWKNFSKNFEKYILSLFITLIIIFPLFLSQLAAVKLSHRDSPGNINYILSASSAPREIILGSLFVYPIVKGANAFAYAPSSYIHLYYSGTLFSLLFFLGGFYYLKKYKSKSLRNISPLFWLGSLSIILSLGYVGGIYLIGVLIPIIKNFSGPFKFTLFTNFFTITFGALILSNIKNINYKKTIHLIILLFSLLILYHIYICSVTSASYYGDNFPLNSTKYDKLKLEGYRSISVFTNSTNNPQLVKFSTNKKNFAESSYVAHNFASYYNVDHISGYETFNDYLTNEKISIGRFGLTNVKLNLTTLKEYGVKYIFIPKDSLIYHTELNNLSIKYEEDDLLILEMPDPKGYVFYGSGNIGYKNKNNRIYFSTNFTENQNVTLNFLFKEGYHVKISGVKKEIYQDTFGRMYLQVPAGKHEIVLYYYSKPLIFGIILAIAFTLLVLFFIRYKEKAYQIINKTILSKNKYFDKFYNFKYIKAILLILLVIIILFSFTIIFKSFTSTDQMEKIFYSRIGLKVSIDKSHLRLTNGKIELEKVALYNEANEIFYSEIINFDVDYIQSIKESISNKMPIIEFSDIKFTNLHFNTGEKNNTKVCLTQLIVKTDKSYLNKSFYSDEITLSNASLKVPNKAKFDIGRGEVLVENKSLKLSGEILIEKYIHGNVTLGENSNYVENRCISLPIEKNNLFYSS